MSNPQSTYPSLRTSKSSRSIRLLRLTGLDAISGDLEGELKVFSLPSPSAFDAGGEALPTRASSSLQKTSNFGGIGVDGDQAGLEAQSHPESDLAPPYVALSYVWGNPESVGRVFLNDTFHIGLGLNAFEFLSSLWRHHVRERAASGSQQNYTNWIWIDSICINQGHIAERNHQVTLMGEIYSTAREIYVWLGPWQDVYRRLIDLAHSGTGEALDVSFLDSDFDVEDGASVDAAARDINNHPYWSRLWIVQEFVLARSITFHYGPGVMTLPELEAILNKLRDWLSTRGTKDVTSRALDLFGMRTAYNTGHFNQLALIHLIRQIGQSSECSNPRDTVYGLLALAVPRPGLAPDYSISPAALAYDVVADAVRNKHVESTKQLHSYYHGLFSHLVGGHDPDVERRDVQKLERDLECVAGGTESGRNLTDLLERLCMTCYGWEDRPSVPSLGEMLQKLGAVDTKH